ncbi:MAG: glycosyltransferase family 4 protein [Alphaproteobacteria bacterium]|nr:glycosyltransferase family 4 protein [Alphaproteobacteria bacterium]
MLVSRDVLERPPVDRAGDRDPLVAAGPSLRILLVHEMFAPDFRGGGEYVVLEAARILQARGMSVRVLCAGDPAMRAYEGIATRRLRRPRHMMNLAVASVARAARDADLVHTFTYNAAWAGMLGARLAGKPCVLGVLGLFGQAWLDMRGAIAGRLRIAGEHVLMRGLADRILFLSDGSRDVGVAFGADPARCRVVPPGIDERCFAPGAAKSDTVLFIGKVDVRKGIGEVLAAAAALPHIPFRIVGWGEAFGEWAARAPANATFVPYERGPAAFTEFARARLFVLPSHAETFGLAVAEAMASGCAVVSSVGLPFAGARVQAGDAQAVTDAIRRLWEDRDACARAAEENRERAKCFTWAAHGAGLEAVYREILAAPAAPSRPRR